MKIAEALLELQENIEKAERAKKIILDGSYLYLLRKMKKEFEDTKEKYNSKVKLITSIKNEYATISKELKDLTTKIEKDENDLYNNSGSDIKAINALQNNIKNNKNKLKALEDKGIDLLELEEKYKLEIELEKAELINLKNNFYSYKETTAKKIEDGKIELENINEKIEMLKNSIPANYLELFEGKLKEKKQAVAKISGGSCSGCKMKVSAMTMDKIAKKEEIVTCDNCGRILVKDDAIKLKEAK
jgi:predicted  nucleic acid-binding Zn-ribbon protein